MRMNKAHREQLQSLRRREVGRGAGGCNGDASTRHGTEPA